MFIAAVAVLLVVVLNVVGCVAYNAMTGQDEQQVSVAKQQGSPFR